VTLAIDNNLLNDLAFFYGLEEIYVHNAKVFLN